MKELIIILPVCCCIASSWAQAIDCLSAPNRSDPGWWSWREIEGRKCWYKKVGAVPAKSEFTWPEQAKETSPAGALAQQELSPIPPTEATATLPKIEVARVKRTDPTGANFRLSEDRVGLIEGSELSGFRGVGGAWEVPAYIKFPSATFDARYGQW